MHLMVTNLILNLHIVVVESIVEVAHAYEYADPMLKLNGCSVALTRNLRSVLWC